MYFPETIKKFIPNYQSFEFEEYVPLMLEAGIPEDGSVEHTDSDENHDENHDDENRDGSVEQTISDENHNENHDENHDDEEEDTTPTLAEEIAIAKANNKGNEECENCEECYECLLCKDMKNEYLYKDL